MNYSDQSFTIPFYYILIGAVIIIVLILIGLYNNIIRRKNQVHNAFGAVDSMLKKRYDLLPNLVEVVKQYMVHEASLFTEITRLRSQLDNPISDKDKIITHNNLNRNIEGMMVAVENYPQLKASQNFLDLQASWNSVEEQISAARRFYNSAVTMYNNSVQTFPSNIVSRFFNFTEMNVFEIAGPERENISAKELFKS